MKTILVTGFEPFGGDARNPSAEIAQALDGETIAGSNVIGATLPCTFAGAGKKLLALRAKHHPHLIVGLGLAANRREITPERVALNLVDARIPDNAGRQPVERPVVATGPVAYWSSLPNRAIVRALAAERLPASISQTAGAFVCNHAFYLFMHALRHSRNIRAGFIHLPWPSDWPPQHLREATLTYAQLAEGVRIAVETTLRVRR